MKCFALHLVEMNEVLLKKGTRASKKHIQTFAFIPKAKHCYAKKSLCRYSHVSKYIQKSNFLSTIATGTSFSEWNKFYLRQVCNHGCASQTL